VATRSRVSAAKAACTGWSRTSPSTTEIRQARSHDGPALTRIDRATWSATTSPAPPPPDGTPFFGLRTTPADVLVAVVDGAVAGYVSIRPATELQASSHVQHVNGLAVDPALQGRGVGSALVEAAAAEARRRGARRLTLRVLGPNVAARRLYDACGFVVEGVLRGEFFLDGEDVDDVMMARTL
jgi:ribosomal protein S18 acetylase RimI-like enzyme